jgi:hypothetical protein
MIDPGDLENHWDIEIQDGTYKGVVFKFLSVHFNEKEDEDGYIRVKFNHELRYVPEDVIIEDRADFEDTLGEILHEVLIGLAERDDGTDRNNNSKKLNP